MELQRMKNAGRILLLCLVWMTVSTVAWAADTGSISVTVKDSKSGTVATGGQLTLYKVADPILKDSQWEYLYTDDFADCGVVIDADAINSPAKLTASLVAYTKNNGLEGTTATLDKEGKASFPGLSQGVYLVRQTQRTKENITFNDFLVTIPYQETYDVDATPKVSARMPSGPVTPDQPSDDNPKAPESPDEMTPDRPSDTPLVTNPDEDIWEEDVPLGTLPQTGQLWWPVPLLAVGGMMFIGIGWRKERSGAHES